MDTAPDPTARYTTQPAVPLGWSTALVGDGTSTWWVAIPPHDDSADVRIDPEGATVVRFAAPLYWYEESENFPEGWTVAEHGWEADVRLPDGTIVEMVSPGDAWVLRDGRTPHADFWHRVSDAIVEGHAVEALEAAGGRPTPQDLDDEAPVRVHSVAVSIPL